LFVQLYFFMFATEITVLIDTTTIIYAKDILIINTLFLMYVEPSPYSVKKRFTENDLKNDTVNKQ
jgi:hypothetical protein